MKILYLCPDSGVPVLGHKGASVHVRELIGAFARAGHDVTLAAQTLQKSPLHPPAKIRARLIHVNPTGASLMAVRDLKEFNGLIGLASSLPGELRRLLYNQALYGNLKRRFLRHKPDFIYERASLYATAGAKLAAKFNVPHLVELNAPLALEQMAYRSTGFGQLAAQCERWLVNQADAVIAVSSELGKHTQTLGVSTQKIHVMPNGVNPELFCPSAVHGSASAPTIGFVGGLRPWHGVEILPDLLGRLSRRRPDLRMVIAGDGQLRNEIQRRFREHGLLRRVRFTGALPHEQVPEVIRRFQVAVAPYPRPGHDFYFSPLKLYEYMACGVPVVASRVGQITQTVRHGRTGLLYPPGNLAALANCCEALLEDARLRSRLGEAAAKFVLGNYTWNHNAARVVALAEKLIADRKGGR